MQIRYLADHPQHFPEIARWIHDEWGYLRPNVTLEQRIAGIQKWTQKRMIPTAFVAISGDEPVGCAALVAHDMDTRRELSPWLASVFVVPERRRQGIASQLVRRVVRESCALGVPTLYLFTMDQERLYAGLGWSVLERTQYHGKPVVIMQISPQNP